MRRISVLSPVVLVLFLLALCLSSCKIAAIMDGDSQNSDDKQSETNTDASQNASDNKVYNRLAYYDLLMSETNDRIVSYSTADFDGDGINEAFATTCSAAVLPENSEHGQMRLWFLKKDKATLLLDTCELAVQPNVWGFEDKKLYCIEVYGEEEYLNRSKAFFVSGNGAYCYGELGSGLTRLNSEKDDFISFCYDTELYFDNEVGEYSGMTKKPYYLSFDGNFFHEYGGTVLYEEELRKLSGIGPVLSEIGEYGWKLGSAFYRENGVVNINISRTSEEGKEEKHNVTLVKNDDGVYRIKPVGDGEPNLTEPHSFSYGGEYKSCAFAEICDYPKLG